MPKSTGALWDYKDWYCEADTGYADKAVLNENTRMNFNFSNSVCREGLNNVDKWMCKKFTRIIEEILYMI